MQPMLSSLAILRDEAELELCTKRVKGYHQKKKVWQNKKRI